MRALKKLIGVLAVGSIAVCFQSPPPCFAQVSPAELRDPALKETEQAYFKQLMEVNRSLAKMQFPFPFVLSRYVGLDPKRQANADTRGLEFVRFHGRLVLKVSGDYNAAFSAGLLTENQRANRLLDDVIVPVLRLLTASFPSDAKFDSYGFEIAWHVRQQTHNYDYEGREIIALVLNKADALSYLSAQRESQRQEVLDRSEIYVNGKEFGLALGDRDPVSAAKAESASSTPPAHDSDANATLAASDSDKRLTTIYQDPLPGLRATAKAQGGDGPVPPDPKPAHTPDKPQAATPEPLQAEIDGLQKAHRTELDILVREGGSKLHFVDYAPPSFVAFRNRLYLQLTLRNSIVFDKSATSIYKRAAQSFDLFLAPLLSALLEKVPKDPGITGLDITVLNQFDSKSAPSSEALEFVCPLLPLQQFASAEITNQDLINQSVVLVNGIRIALNLAQVE